MTHKPTLNEILYSVAWTLAQATKEALAGEVENCHVRLEEIERDIAQYKASILSNREPEGAKYQSEGARPEGWKTIIEYLWERDPEFLQYSDYLAIDTMSYGVRAARLMKDYGCVPVRVEAPECIAADRHILTVNAYPVSILEKAIH